MSEADDATGIDDVGPGVQESAQFGVVLGDEERLSDIHRSDGNDDSKSDDAVYGKTTQPAIDDRLDETEQGRQHANEQDGEPQCPTEECGGLGIAGIEDVLDGSGINHHAVGPDEINGGGIDDGEDGKQQSTHLAQNEHSEAGQQVVERQHQHNE